MSGKRRNAAVEGSVSVTFATYQQRASALRTADQRVKALSADSDLAMAAERRAAHEAFYAALDSLYASVHEAIRLIRAGDTSGVEPLVTFLEADVYAFRSGYLKQETIRFLTRAALTPKDERRLHHVVLDVVDAYDRQEFGAYARLARRVDTPELRAELESRCARSPSSGVRRRAGWILDRL